MGHDSIRLMILGELRTLRREPGLLDAAKLSTARAIVKGLGGDDPDVALQRLIDLVAEHPDDRDLDAAMATVGWGVESAASLDRLSEYGAHFDKDPRTVRRWSDDGFHKLALLIVGKAPWIQPRAKQVLSVEGDEIRYGLDLRIPPNLRMDTPELVYGDQPVEIGMTPVVVSDQPQRIASRLVPIATLADLPVRLSLTWHGEKYPIYEALTHGTRDVYFSSRIVFLSMRTTVSRSKSMGLGEEPEDTPQS